MAIGSSIQRASTALHAFDVDGLYIILSKQDVPDRYHWGIYFHTGPSGWIYHCTRVADSWFLDSHLSTNIIYSLSMVAALKIAIVDHPQMKDALKARIPQVPLSNTTRYGPLTCRTWVLRVVDELNIEGHISLKPGTSVENVEAEATLKATRAAANSTQTIDKSSFSIA